MVMLLGSLALGLSVMPLAMSLVLLTMPLASPCTMVFRYSRVWCFWFQLVRGYTLLQEYRSACLSSFADDVSVVMLSLLLLMLLLRMCKWVRKPCSVFQFWVMLQLWRSTGLCCVLSDASSGTAGGSPAPWRRRASTFVQPSSSCTARRRPGPAP